MSQPALPPAPPAFAHKLGTRAGNISARFRAEHDQIRSLLTAIEAKLTQGDAGTATEESALETLLGAHNHREHEAIYPVVHLGS